MKKIFFLLIIIALTGCAKSNRSFPTYEATSGPQSTCYGIAERLSAQLHQKGINEVKILKAPFVDINNVEHISTTGRAYSEFISSRLCQLGFKVVELKMREGSIKITSQGEMLLSNDQINLAREYDAAAALIGYYKSSYNRDVALFARIIDINDNTMLAVDDVCVW